jgi:LemA protein
VDTQWAQVETQYQRRFDLVPNLVAAAQAVMTQEKDVFTAIATARQGYAGAKTVNDKVQAANQLEGALSRLLVITENYPVLKTSEIMQNLQAQLEGTENRISVERMRYNDMVKEYNIKVKTFPGSLFAHIFGFEVKKTFEADTDAKKAPQVKFQ